MHYAHLCRPAAAPPINTLVYIFLIDSSRLASAVLEQSILDMRRTGTANNTNVRKCRVGSVHLSIESCLLLGLSIKYAYMRVRRYINNTTTPL